ncbi:MAG: HPr family phosphocarrier protein [Anaerolineae bacterium]
MPTITLTIRNPVGLHARPAALFVQTAQRYVSEIRVRSGGREANAKSILGILTLGAGQGATITVEAEGEDAPQALAALQALVELDFGDSA